MSLRPIQKSASTSVLFAMVATLVLSLFLATWPGTAGAQSPEIDIETSTNGVDADAGPGPTLNPGESVTWTYRVTVNGPSTLFDLIVSDSSGLEPNCDVTGDGAPDGTHIHPGPLDAGQSFVCTATGTVQAAATGTYSNTGSVKGFDFDGITQFVDRDSSHHTPKALFIPEPGVGIQALVNGVDANSGPGPYIAEDSTITWTYVVTNTGNVPLNSVSVTNTGGVIIDCGGQKNLVPGSLSPGASATCTATTSAAKLAAGLQTSSGSVLATAIDPTSGATLNQLTAQDVHNYTPVQLPGALAFTGPSPYLVSAGLALLVAGLGLRMTGSAIGQRRRPIAQQ